MKIVNKHPYHLVDPSPWPLIASFGCFFLTSGLVMFFHGYLNSLLLIMVGLVTILFIMFTWWRDVVRESTYEGHHTFIVQKGLKNGMVLFIISEVMFFFCFFWAFFHSALAPVPELASLWPPLGIVTIGAGDIPLLNTIILLSSGITITWAHHSLVCGDRNNTLQALLFTISLALIFTFIQIFEYIDSNFTISDSVYGSVFFLATGFHGFHVIIGTIFLIVVTIRLVKHHFTKELHFGFEAAAWYWHFVDVVWLFLFIVIYWWGGK
jgi:cytochrome c oxidase subunit 3